MVYLRRCFKPLGIGKVVDCSLHHFSDARENGYGQPCLTNMVKHVCINISHSII